MAIIAPRVYFDNSNYRDPLGAIIAGANEETQRRENLKDQRTKRAVAKQLGAINANDARMKEIEAGFGAADTYGGGPRMGGSAETGSTEGQHLDVPAGVANQLAAIRRQVGTSLQTGHYEDGIWMPGPLGPRTGPSDEERLASEKHGYQMEEDRANNAARMALATAGDTAAMARLNAQLANADARAYDQNHIVPESTKYVQRQENYRAGLAHRDANKAERSERVAALRVEQQNAHSITQAAQDRLKQFQAAVNLHALNPDTPLPDEAEEAVNDYQAAVTRERAISDALARETGVTLSTPIAAPSGQPVIRGGIPKGYGSTPAPASTNAAPPKTKAAPRTTRTASPSGADATAASAAFREANAKAARLLAKGAPEAEVKQALAEEVAMIAKRYGLSGAPR